MASRLGKNWEELIARLFVVVAARHHRGAHRIYSRQLDRSPAYRRRALGNLALQRLLEDVLHRDPAGSDSLPAHLLRSANRAILPQLSAWRARGPHRAEPSSHAGRDCL